MKETVLANTALFASLTDEQRALIAERMAIETRRAGDLICSHGRPARAMYVVSVGWVRLMSEQLMVLANLGPGSVLGEADVLLGRPYTITAEAATDVTLLALSTTDLAEIVHQEPEIGRQLRIAAGATDDMDKIRHLRRLSLMAGLGTEQLREVAQYLRAEKFAAGQGIYCRGTFGNALYLVDQGQVSVQRPGHPAMIVGSGDLFGLSALLPNQPHSSEVSALTDVSVWSLSRDDFEKLALRYPILALNLARLLSQRLRQSYEDEAVVSAIPLVATPPPAQPAVVTPAVPRRVAPVVAPRRQPTSVQASGWFRSLSTGAKVRFIAVVVLLVWLVGIAVPLTILNLFGSSAPAPAARPAHASAQTLQERVVRVALAADLPVNFTPTYTPWPTETPIPTPTFTPTPTPTNTPIPTPTFTPTPTPIPPTATPVPPPPVARAVVAAAAAPTEPPKPTTQFSLIEKRRLTPCENRGKHNIFVKVVDAGGNPIDGVTLVQSPHGQPGNVLDKSVSGTKGPGLAEFTMWKGGVYAVYVSTDGANPANTEIAGDLHSAFPDEASCPDGGGGNTLYHNSFSLIFRKNF